MKRLSKIFLLIATLSVVGTGTAVNAASHNDVARGLCHCSY